MLLQFYVVEALLKEVLLFLDYSLVLAYLLFYHIYWKIIEKWIASYWQRFKCVRRSQSGGHVLTT
jgi:hypothetical protein